MQTRPSISPRAGLAFFCLLFFAYGYVHQKNFDGPTAVSRLDLLHSMIRYGTVRIDHYHKNTPDKAVYQGHYYSDKAPATVALALPSFATAAGLLRMAGQDLDSPNGWMFSSWFSCVFSLGLITAGGGVALFVWLSRWTSPRAALITSSAVYLGAAPFPYSTMMFSHAATVAWLSIALWALDLGLPRESGMPVVSRRRDLLAGFACGWALAGEHSSGLIVVAIGLWVLLTDRLPCARVYCADWPGNLDQRHACGVDR